MNRDCHDLSRVIMAICNLQGIWDGEMRIPSPSRPIMVDYDGPHWKLDERGYPAPSEALVRECARLREREMFGVTAPAPPSLGRKKSPRNGGLG